MVNSNNITAYNVKNKKTEVMIVKNIYKTPIMKQGQASPGKYRYRFAGVSSDGETKMSKFVKAEEAEEYALNNNMTIETKQPAKKPVKKPAKKKLTCEQIGEDCKTLCIEKRENQKIMRDIRKKRKSKKNL